MDSRKLLETFHLYHIVKWYFPYALEKIFKEGYKQEFQTIFIILGILIFKFGIIVDMPVLLLQNCCTYCQAVNYKKCKIVILYKKKFEKNKKRKKSLKCCWLRVTNSSCALLNFRTRLLLLFVPFSGYYFKIPPICFPFCQIWFDS